MCYLQEINRIFLVTLKRKTNIFESNCLWFESINCRKCYTVTFIHYMLTTCAICAYNKLAIWIDRMRKIINVSVQFFSFVYPIYFIRGKQTCISHSCSTQNSSPYILYNVSRAVCQKKRKNMFIQFFLSLILDSCVHCALFNVNNSHSSDLTDHVMICSTWTTITILISSMFLSKTNQHIAFLNPDHSIDGSFIHIEWNNFTSHRDMVACVVIANT